MLVESAGFLLTLLLAAVVLDLILGEPPAAVHPVVWMGKATLVVEKILRRSRIPLKVAGIILVFTIMFLFVGSATALQIFRSHLNPYVYIMVSIFLLKSSFAIRALRVPSLKIAEAVKDGNLDEARKWVPHLVRRDPSKLDKQHILSAAIESIAESTVDGFTSTVLFFLIFGLPGAVAFRVINTLDSMVGYRNERYIHFGWFAARLDDLANWVPARFTGLLMVVASFFTGADYKKAWRILIRDRKRIPSPNSGWTEATMAGALRVQLEEVGHHTLGDDEKPIEPEDVISALEISSLSAFLFCGLGFLTAWLCP